MWKEDKYIVTKNIIEEIITKYFNDLIELGEIIKVDNLIITVFKIKNLQDRKITVTTNKSYQEIKLLIFEFIKNIIIVEREVTREVLKSITERVTIEDKLETYNRNLLNDE